MPRADLMTDEQLDRLKAADFDAWLLLDDIQRDCLAEAGEEPLVVIGQGDYRKTWAREQKG